MLYTHHECVYYFRYLWGNKVDELEVWRPHNWTYGKKYREVISKKKTCGRPFSGPVQIQADGKMIVCCFDFNGELEVGDTYEKSIEFILKDQPFEAIRWAHSRGSFNDSICESCDQRNIETESPLLYSSIDKNCEVGKTSSTKFKLGV